MAHKLEEFIALGMAEDVVDVLEAIEVDIENGEGLGVALGGRECLLQCIDEPVAIGQGRQLIRAREPRDLGVRRRAVVDIDAEAFDFGDTAALIAHRRDAALEQTWWPSAA